MILKLIIIIGKDTRICGIQRYTEVSETGESNEQVLI